MDIFGEDPASAEVAAMRVEQDSEESGPGELMIENLNQLINSGEIRSSNFTVVDLRSTVSNEVNPNTAEEEVK